MPPKKLNLFNRPNVEKKFRENPMSHDVLGREVPSASSSLTLRFADILPNVDHLLWSCCPTIAGTMMATSGSPDAGPIRETAPLLIQRHCLWVCSTGTSINLESWPMSISLDVNTDHYNCRQSITLKVANIPHFCVLLWLLVNTYEIRPL